MNNIQSLSNRPREIGVTEAIEPAYERVKQMLFKPFDLTKWIVIGFCAWLAGLGESGGGGFNGYNDANHNFIGDNGGEHLRQAYHQARDYVLANLYWIVPVAITVAVIFVALWLVIIWLSSRGKFMFLHCVALNRAEVEEPWRKFAGPANSLFRFRIVVSLIGMILVLPLVALIGLSILQMIRHGEPDVAGVMAVIGLVLVLLLLSLVFAIIRKLLVDFVVPIMFLRGGTCLAAWREFGALVSGNAGKFIVYLLFQIVLAMAIGAMLVLAVLVTCCIAGCFMLLPFVGTVLLLPVLIFKRAYPLYYLTQFGPQYDVFPIPPAAAAPPASPLQPLAVG